MKKKYFLLVFLLVFFIFSVEGVFAKLSTDPMLGMSRSERESLIETCQSYKFSNPETYPKQFGEVGTRYENCWYAEYGRYSESVSLVPFLYYLGGEDESLKGEDNVRKKGEVDWLLRSVFNVINARSGTVLVLIGLAVFTMLSFAFGKEYFDILIDKTRSEDKKKYVDEEATKISKTIGYIVIMLAVSIIGVFGIGQILRLLAIQVLG
jgi:hypothetical protein